MKKTILYIGGFELPDKNAAAQRVIANAKLFREIEHEVILLGVDKQLAGGNGITRYESPVCGFPAYAIPYPEGIFSWLRFICRKRLIARFAKENKVDAIVAYNFPAIALFRLMRWCRSHGVKMISDCTEWYLPNGNFVRKAIKQFDISFRMRVVHPQLDGLIAISRYLRDWYSPRMAHVWALPPLVDKTEEKWFLDKAVLGEEELCFVYAGSPGATKDRLDWILSILAEAFAQTEIPFKFYILGLSERDYKERASVPENISSFVVFKGRVPHVEVIRMLKGADYQVFFRERNLPNMAGFPTKFVESISCGIPVITNRFSNVDDYLDEGKNGILVDLENRQATLNAICEIFRKGREERPHAEENTFDYRNYISSAKTFFDKIFHRSN